MRSNIHSSVPGSTRKSITGFSYPYTRDEEGLFETWFMEHCFGLDYSSEQYIGRALQTLWNNEQLAEDGRYTLGRLPYRFYFLFFKDLYAHFPLLMRAWEDWMMTPAEEEAELEAEGYTADNRFELYGPAITPELVQQMEDMASELYHGYRIDDEFYEEIQDFLYFKDESDDGWNEDFGSLWNTLVDLYP